MWTRPKDVAGTCPWGFRAVTWDVAGTCPWGFRAVTWDVARTCPWGFRAVTWDVARTCPWGFRAVTWDVAGTCPWGFRAVTWDVAGTCPWGFRAVTWGVAGTWQYVWSQSHALGFSCDMPTAEGTRSMNRDMDCHGHVVLGLPTCLNLPLTWRCLLPILFIIIIEIGGCDQQGQDPNQTRYNIYKLCV